MLITKGAFVQANKETCRTSSKVGYNPSSHPFSCWFSKEDAEWRLGTVLHFWGSSLNSRWEKNSSFWRTNLLLFQVISNLAAQQTPTSYSRMNLWCMWKIEKSLFSMKVKLWNGMQWMPGKSIFALPPAFTNILMLSHPWRILTLD